MDCRQAQDEILELLDDRPSVIVPERIDVHLSGCPDCTAFVRRQVALDARFAAVLTPPELSASFRGSLRQRIRRESPAMAFDALPDMVHFASCAAATILCVVVLPFAAGPILAAGAMATLITYLLLTAARIWFEA